LEAERVEAERLAAEKKEKEETCVTWCISTHAA
jgi:hypothetical protein